MCYNYEKSAGMALPINPGIFDVIFCVRILFCLFPDRLGLFEYLGSVP